jgi:uroporphyrinogen-III decarboxylase
MQYRQLFNEIMHYGDFHRMPVIHWAAWPETQEQWKNQGLPAGIDERKYFDAVPMWVSLNMNHEQLIDLGLYPCFETEVLEETEEYKIIRQDDGAICKDWKYKSCIPQFLDHTFKTAKDWDHYKKKLQPNPNRIASDIDEKVRSLNDSPYPIAFPGASLMGWFRNWMGMQNFSYLMYDNPEVFSDMVTTMADLVCWGMDQILPKLKVDFVHGWEDICGRQGPLVSPELFRKHVSPGYRKIRDKLESYGLDLYSIDSDGDVRPLVQDWLDAGVNIQFPVEVGPFQGDALELRRKYGKELRVIGNFDKLVLAKGRKKIENEINRLRPLMEEGGFIIMPDHLIQPDVPLDDYKWYLNKIREIPL